MGCEKLHAELARFNDLFALAAGEFCERRSPRGLDQRAVAFDSLRLTAFDREDAQPESVGAYWGNLNFYMAVGNLKILRCGFALAWPKEVRSANCASTFQHLTAMVTIGHESAHQANNTPAAYIQANGPRLYTRCRAKDDKPRAREEENAIPRGRTKRFAGIRASGHRGPGRGRRWG